MQSEQKEVQKKNEFKGGFIFDVNKVREEKQKYQDSNEQGSTTITEEKKKNEEKPKIEENHENSTKTEVNLKNEDKKIVENPSFSPNNINEMINFHKLICEQEKMFNNSYPIGLNSMKNPKNENHYLYEKYFK